MLVLTINYEDTIEMLEGQIKVAILSIRKNKVTIGIDAPKAIDIRRGAKFVREIDKESKKAKKSKKETKNETKA